MFICTHCPYVKHIEKGLAALGLDYDGKPLGIVAISSQRCATHPDDSPDGLERQAQTYGFRFPYLYDEIASRGPGLQGRLHAGFLSLRWRFQLVYRGQFDRSRPSNDIPVTGEDLRAADRCGAGRQAGDRAISGPRSAATLSGRRKKAELAELARRSESSSSRLLSNYAALNALSSRTAANSPTPLQSASPFRYSRNLSPNSGRFSANSTVACSMPNLSPASKRLPSKV